MAPLVLMAGGASPGSQTRITEAQAMRDLAIAAGVPEAALLIEPFSRNTAENAFYCAQMLHPAGLRRIVLISHRAHLFRAALLFRLAGFTVAGRAGVASRSFTSRLLAVLRETAALPRSLLRLVFLRLSRKPS
jgi:uncharacterized SAM-binding protein YcdF (DUF218 family)